MRSATRVAVARVAASVAAAALLSPGRAAAQPEDALPGLPAGVPVVLLPVQAALPGPDGAWPGGAASEAEALEALNAELSFALRERGEAAAWATPDEVVRRAARNPIVGVDPRRVAYQGLLRKPKERQVYEPLHGQLRSLAALFDARLVILPLAVWTGPPPGPGPGEEARRQGTLLLALIDVRRSEVLWHGEIGGPALPAGSAALLAALAERVVRTLVSS